MAAVVNTHDKNISTGTGQTVSKSLTIGGSNRVLYVLALGISDAPQAPDDVRWGGATGTQLTQLGTTQTFSLSSWGRASLWRLIAPASGTADVYVHYAASFSGERILIAVAVEDADQTTPNNTVAVGNTTNSNPSQNATSVAGDLVLDLLGAIDESEGTPETLTKDASQTLLQQYNASDTGGYDFAGASTETASGTSTTMSWTYTAVTSGWGWAQFAFALNGAAASATITPATPVTPVAIC